MRPPPIELFTGVSCLIDVSAGYVVASFFLFVKSSCVVRSRPIFSPNSLRMTLYFLAVLLSPTAQSFHMDSVGATPEDAELHRRDMELHRIHAEPHMVLDSEAWSNLNDRSDSINSPRKKVLFTGILSGFTLIRGVGWGGGGGQASNCGVTGRKNICLIFFA